MEETLTKRLGSGYPTPRRLRAKLNDHSGAFSVVTQKEGRTRQLSYNRRKEENGSKREEGKGPEGPEGEGKQGADKQEEGRENASKEEVERRRRRGVRQTDHKLLTSTVTSNIGMCLTLYG